MPRNSDTERNASHWLRDGGIAAALLIALCMVYGLDTDASSVVPDSSVSQIEETVVTPAAAPGPRMRMGVTPADFDDMGRLLETLGEGYRFDEVQLDELLDPQKLDDLDVLFLTCGGFPDSWLGRRLDESSRGRDVFHFKQEIIERAIENIRSFVRGGGTLYASDWRFGLVAGAFEEFLDPDNAVEGDAQTIEAAVVDSGLRKVLGEHIELRFDQPGWSPAAFRGQDMVTYLRGRYRSQENEDREAPLLVKFPYGEGSVIYTSFHNEKQNSETEMELLRYLVFATVTARTESEIQRTMVEGGFSPASRNLLSASGDDPSVTRTWQCRNAGPVQFVLGFQNEGAVLRLTVVSPSGKTSRKEATSTLQIDISAAEAGEWKYTVTAVAVPYANFPFTLTIGEKG